MGNCCFGEENGTGANSRTPLSKEERDRQRRERAEAAEKRAKNFQQGGGRKKKMMNTKKMNAAIKSRDEQAQLIADIRN